MRNVKKIYFFFSIIIIIIIPLSFSSYKDTPVEVKINLKWYKAHEAESWSNIKTGMLWSFANLGASLPKNCLDSAISFIDSNSFELNLNKLGFSVKALRALELVCNKIKYSDDYKRNNFLDLSRFLVLTLHAPNNYYKITEAETTIEVLKSNYDFNKCFEFGVTNSSVAKKYRLIKFNKDNNILKVAFIAEVGDQPILENNFKPKEYEVITVMPNGHFRYAIYDENGKLSDASNINYSIAGKPSKCMWCHESTYSTLFKENKEVKQKLTNIQFLNAIAEAQSTLDSYRNTLNTEINFNNKQDHTQLELLYISFMEPSIYRLKQEFMDNQDALIRIKKLRTHKYEEFLYLGDLYFRREIDKYFNYNKIRTPYSIREKSSYEPDFFN